MAQSRQGTQESPTYSSMELMICAASRLLDDGAIVGVGTGAPCAAAMLAQKTHAPRLFIIFEAGGLAPRLPSMPISVGDSRTVAEALMATSMGDVFESCQRGIVDYAFLGGANDFASLCWRTMVLTLHDRRRFVEKLDFLTTPGYLTGPGAREAAGLPAGSCPYRVITDLAVLGFHETSKRMQILSLHPGVAAATVQEHTGFELAEAAEITMTERPSAEQLRILREEVDPHRYFLGR